MMMKRIYRRAALLPPVFLLLLLSYSVFAQKLVTGTITDGEGNAMPGVNVVLKGTLLGTTTNGNGTYAIEANEDAVLQFSFIGYITQDIRVGTQTKIDVKLMEDVATLDEIVVIGYGEMKRSDLTTAHTSVSSDQIQKTVNTTIEQAIQGRAAGVYVTQNTGQPGGAVSVNIRGVNTIGGSNEPLYVVDGIQMQSGGISFGNTSSSNPLAGLNPSDIESLEILQGPAATAMYGSRATNGVILIRTKRGKAGETAISYGYNLSYQTAPNKLEVMNLPQYAQMVKDYHALNGGTTPEAFLDPSILGNGTDWQEELFTEAAIHKHQLSFSGGTEKLTYYLSGEYFDQDGIALGSSFKRYSTRLNIDSKARDWFTIGANFSFNQTKSVLTTSQENIIQRALQLTPQIPVKNLDGSWGGGDDTNGANQFAPVNPIALAQLNTNELNTRQVLGGITLTFQIMKGLKASTTMNVNLENNNSVYFTPKYRFGFQSNPTSTLSNRYGTTAGWNWSQMIEYSTQIGKHSFGIMATHEAQESIGSGISGLRSDFVVDNIIDLNIGNAATATNGGGKWEWAMESYLGRINYNFDDRYILMGTVRTDGSVNFGPENKWGVFPSLSAAWRISQEPFFAVPFINELKLRLETGITGNQGGVSGIYSPLGAAPTPWGTGFLPTRYSNPGLKWEETLTNNIGMNMSLLENRFQVEFDYYIKNTDNLLLENPLPWYMGTSGQGSVGPPIVNIGALKNEGFGVTLSAITMDRNGFKWNTDFNISKFKTTIKKFYSESAFIDRTSWWMDDWQQRASVGQAPWLFRGYLEDGLFQSLDDIEASPLPVDNSGNEIPVDYEDGVWVGDVKFKDISGPDGTPDGIIDGFDQTTIGNPWPTAFMGLTNTFSYKGFSLSVLITGTYGNEIYNQIARINSNPNNINLSSNLMQHTQNYARLTTDGDGNPILENPGTNVPRLAHGDGPNDNIRGRHTSKWVEDGSFLRVKNITLSYSLPKSLISKVKFIRATRLTVGAQNIATLTRYTGYDPEVGSYVGRDASAANQAIGVDNGRYPLTPLYTFSVGVDF